MKRLEFIKEKRFCFERKKNKDFSDMAKGKKAAKKTVKEVKEPTDWLNLVWNLFGLLCGSLLGTVFFVQYIYITQKTV